MAEMACSMTPADLELFAEAVSSFCLGKHRDSPRQTAAQAIFALTGAERLVSYEWDKATGKYYNPLLINLSTHHAEHYLNALQDRDPITPRMRRQSGATRIEDILPRDDFERLDFYNDFLKPDDMYHGVNIFLRSGNRHLCDFRLFRGRSSSAFSQRDLVLTDMMSSYLVRALDTTGSDLSVLTTRESEIAGLVARGCTDSDIKRILGISFSTVRTHMNRCFEKLGCANRTELAAFVTQRRQH